MSTYTQKALSAASALLFGVPTAVFADTISNTDFEGGSLSGWNLGTQNGTLTNGTITGNGTGVNLINGPVTFSAGSFGAIGNPTNSDGSTNIYYAPAVSPTTWTFSPYGDYGAALQPTGNVTFDSATSALGLTAEQNQEIKTILQQQQQASGLGSPNPTNAAWITKNVNLDAGKIYTMSWNYIGTDYVPFNDGSITSLVYQGTDGANPQITVNNSLSNYALLGFTNPGTGDYSTGTYGSTGWQNATYEVDTTGDYLLGFAVFNLGDTALSPVLLVDSQPGITLKNGETFDAVTPNNPNAPTVNQTTDPSGPTVTGTNTVDDVTTSSSVSNVSITSQNTYDVNELDENGFGTIKNYTDTIVTTTPVTTVTTTTTPVTTTTYSDGSTTTSNGTPVVTTSSTEGTSSSEVTGTTLNYTSTITPSVSQTTEQSTTLPQQFKNTYNYKTTESSGSQKVKVHVATEVKTPVVTTVVTTPVVTTTFADGTETSTNGTSVTTYVESENVTVVDTYKNLSGRIDQLEVLDGINDNINGLLFHEPSQTKQKFRLFNNNHFVQSYNADGYSGKSQIYGGGFEIDLSEGWTVGWQYNNIQINLTGVDSISKQIKEHYGIFNSFHGNTFSLITNGAMASSRYDVQRTVENAFYNKGETSSKEWWVSNRLYWHLSKWISPFVGHTVHNMSRNAYKEQWYSQTARTVETYNQTTHSGEVGLKLETRFGGKKNDVIGIGVDASYGIDNSYGVTASIDCKEVIFVEGSHSVSDGVTNNSVAAKVKFRF